MTGTPGGCNRAETGRAPWKGAGSATEQPLDSGQGRGRCRHAPLTPPSRLPLAFSHLSPTAANGTRPAEPWSCHFCDLLADLAGKKKKQQINPKLLQAAPKSRSHPSPGAVSAPRAASPGPGRRTAAGAQHRDTLRGPQAPPGSGEAALRAPTHPAGMRCRVWAQPGARQGLPTPPLLAGLRRSQRGAAHNYLQRFQTHARL